MKKYFSIKEPDVDLEEFYYVNPALAIVFNYFLMYADLYGLDVIITSISEKVSGRISSTHSEFRAIDLSLKNWPDLHQRRVAKRLNEVYRHWSTGPQNGIKRVAVIHDAGSGRHMHLQIRRNVKMDIL